MHTMSLKFLSFFLGMFLFMTYGVTHLHSPALINSACIAFADDDEIDTPEEIADELDDVTEEEDFLEDQEEAVEEQEEEVIEEVKKN
jgi:hypothetical protein